MLYGTVTVHIDHGTYEEAVWVMPHVHHGLHVIALEGDPNSPQDVVLDGNSVVAENQWGITVMGDPIVQIRGITITRFDKGLVCIYGALIEIEDSVLVDNGRGLEAELSGTINVFDTTFSSNDTGIRASNHGTVGVGGATHITDSGSYGVRATDASVVFFDTDGSSCHVTGVKRAETSSSILGGGICSGSASCEADSVSTCSD